MGFFLAQWALIVIGLAIHAGLDRSPARHTRARVLELAGLWVIVSSGIFGIVGGLFHVGPTSDSIATSIGYTQSMFQWEVGFADIAIGVLLVLCARRGNRGAWMTAAMTIFAISFYGDGIGHVMQLVAHDNTATDNVWAMPTCFLAPTLAIALIFAARRASRPVVDSPTDAPAVERIPAAAE